MEILPLLVFSLFAVIPLDSSHTPRDYCRTAHGAHSSIRKCCSQHSSCPVHIERGAIKYGLTNDFNYVVYYCHCETSFYKCLSRVDTGRSISTRKAHFLEAAGDRAKTRECLELTEKKVCSKRFMGICLRGGEKALFGRFRDVSDFL